MVTYADGNMHYKKGSNKMLKVKVKVLDSRASLCQETIGSAGYDLCAILDCTLVLLPGSASLVGTGISLYIEDPNYVGLILPRSGLGHRQGLILGNSTGVIDSDYQGEIKVSLWNRGENPIVVKNLQRVAQLLIVPVAKVDFELVEEYRNTSSRGIKGFGSTGD